MLKELASQFSLPNQLSFAEIRSGFPVIKVNNEHASATISLYGGQLLEYQPKDQSEPLIWLSEQSLYKKKKAIRGGIPICWPWFGAAETQFSNSKLPSHGFARISLWNILSTQVLCDGGTEIILSMPCHHDCLIYKEIQTEFDCHLTLKITINASLTLELTSSNHSNNNITISEAMHSYFNVSDIHNIRLQGLEQLKYLDKLKDGNTYEQESELQFTAETDRVFIDTIGDIKLDDAGFNRSILISKNNSTSTVIWNPWKENSLKMDDMSDEGWINMVCIEPANVHSNQLILNPGETHSFSQRISVQKLN